MDRQPTLSRAMVFALCIAAASVAAEPGPGPGGQAAVAAAPAGTFALVTVSTDKAMYDLGEPVVIQVAAQPQAETEAVLTLTVRRGADAPRRLLEEAVKLLPGTAVEKRLTWTPGQSEYGHEVAATLRPAGAGDAVRASALFEICSDWPKVARWATAESCKDCAPDDIRARIGGRKLPLDEVMANLRSRYFNTYELYCFPPHPYELDVKAETWPPPYESQARRGLVTSAVQVARVRKALTESGLKLVIYNETSSFHTAEPQYLGYRPDNGELNIVYPMGRDEIDPNAFAIAGLFGRELAASIRRFGWDGVFMDSGSQSMYATYWCKDKDGNRLTDRLPGEVGEYYVGTAREHTAAANPRFKFVSQNMNASVIARHYHSRLPLGEMEPAIERYYRALKWDRYAAAVDMFSLEYQMPEVVDEKKAIFCNRLDRMIVAFNTFKRLTHRPQLAWFQINHPDSVPELAKCRTVGAAKPILAAIFAARTSLADYGNNYGGQLTGAADDPVNRAFIDYHRFILRYSQYLSDLELEWVRTPEPEIQVRAASPLCWQHTVYRRQFADREETVVNLLQFPADGLIYAVRPTELPPVADVVVSWPAALVLPEDSQNRNYLRPATANPTDVFAMSPDAADQAPVPLAVRREGERFAVTVPGVETWTMLLIRKNFPEYDRARFVKGQVP